MRSVVAFTFYFFALMALFGAVRLVVNNHPAIIAVCVAYIKDHSFIIAVFASIMVAGVITVAVSR